MAKSSDPTREIARMALRESALTASDVLQDVIEYAFDQLCWSWSTVELAELLAGLNAKLSQDA